MCYWNKPACRSPWLAQQGNQSSGVVTYGNLGFHITTGCRTIPISKIPLESHASAVHQRHANVDSRNTRTSVLPAPASPNWSLNFFASTQTMTTYNGLSDSTQVTGIDSPTDGGSLSWSNFNYTAGNTVALGGPQQYPDGLNKGQITGGCPAKLQRRVTNAQLCESPCTSHAPADRWPASAVMCMECTCHVSICMH
jgi:hypothetical protein